MRTSYTQSISAISAVLIIAFGLSSVVRAEAINGANSDEERILAIGEISTTRYVLGGILGTYPLGLGVGHVIQGRYLDKGWIFTLGELGALLLVASGATECLTDLGYFQRCDNPSMVVGVYAYTGLRIWEAIDLWVAPPDHNRKFREIRDRRGLEKDVSVFLGPHPQGMALGLNILF